MKLHLGCGSPKRHKYGEEWVNVDSNPRHEPDVVADLSRPFPWDEGSATAIESYHLIEHMTMKRATFFLSECFRVLCHGGTIAIECPDLAALCALYATNPVRATRSIYGLQTRGDAMRHRYGYSRESLAAAMRAAGFEVVAMGDGTDYHAAEEPCMRAEGRKP